MEEVLVVQNQPDRIVQKRSKVVGSLIPTLLVANRIVVNRSFTYEVLRYYT